MQPTYPTRTTHPTSPLQDGFTLLEAMVALAIVAMVVTSYLGIRTSALIDGIEARNWRLARELAEQKMSELLAGAHEVRPESGVETPFENYEGFAVQVLIGEASITDHESELADAESGNGEVGERLEWQRNRENYRKAAAEGLNAWDYQEKVQQEEYQKQLEDKVPSEDEFEEVAVVVYFPKTDPEYEGERENYVIKARASTLALSGLTPEQADLVAKARGETGATGAAGATPPGGAPGTEGQ